MAKLKSKITAEEFDGLEDALKGLYAPAADGATFTLDAEGVEDVGGLKSALEKEREGVKSLKKQLQELNARFGDLDPDEFKRLKELEAEITKKREEDERNKQITNNDFESREKQLLDKHAKHVKEIEKKFTAELEARESRVKTLTNALHKELIESAAVAAIAREKGVPELLLPHIRQATRVLETENGGFRVEIVDQEGNQRVSTDPKSTAPMTISELVQEMKGSQTFGRAFEGSGISGAGTTQGAFTTGDDGTYRISRERAGDLQTYIRAKEAAAKAGKPLEIVNS